jgi:hypothetical protein
MLFAPELASARLDYAEAMAILGDREAARAWMMDVLAHDQPPDIIAERIRARLDRLADSRWYSNARFGLKAGYDTNPMLSPRLSNLTLTLPSGWVTLPVEGKSTRGSSITQAEMQIASQRLPSSADGGTLTLLADARWRYPFNDSSARYSEISGGAVWEQPVGPTLESAGNTPKRWTALAGVTGSVVTLGGSSLFRSTRLMLGTAAPTACQPRAMLDWEHRTYPSSPTLNGDYSGIAASATCGVGEQSMINLGLRAGMDRPTDLRPGGRQERIEGRIGGQHPLYGGRLEGDLVLTRLSDAESYSPILAEAGLGSRGQRRAGATTEQPRTVLAIRDYHSVRRTHDPGLVAGGVSYRRRPPRPCKACHTPWIMARELPARGPRRSENRANFASMRGTSRIAQETGT